MAAVGFYLTFILIVVLINKDLLSIVTNMATTRKFGVGPKENYLYIITSSQQ